MKAFIYHVASGMGFFSGSAMLLLASACRNGGRWWQRVADLLCILGAIFIAISSTPLPIWFYVVGVSFALAWLTLPHWPSPFRRWKTIVALAFPAIVFWGVCWEFPYHLPPTIEKESANVLVIWGDSVTAGIGDDGVETWPQILERTRSITIHDHARMGATVSTAVEQIRESSIPSGLILLEIGGNDLLGSTSAKQFQSDLKMLLEQLSSHSGQIVMFELPLPPFYHEYGRIQRNLAQRYNVKLIPKRIFMRILAEDQSTLDSIHLSQAGHEQFADAVWQVIGTAFENH